MDFHLNGFKVVASEYMQDFTLEPNRKLNFKRWMVGKAYGLRVQKKWNKRYGVSSNRLFITNGKTIFTSPANAQHLKYIMREQHHEMQKSKCIT